MLSLIFESMFYALPIYFTNSFGTLSASIPFVCKWSTPIDMGLELNGKRILGKGKTFRGVVVGIILGLITSLVQYYITTFSHFGLLEFFNQTTLFRCVTLGFFLSAGALLGDITKSFIKRRIGIKSGRPWIPFDQVDFLIGGLLLGAFIYFPGWKSVLVLAIITPFGHLSTNVLAYFLHLKDVWW